MEEIWKDVVGYEGKYSVSNFGNVLSHNWRGTGKSQILTPKISITLFICQTGGLAN